MTDENDKIALRTALERERQTNASLHQLLLDIREAAGDQHGRMTLAQLVGHIRKTRIHNGQLREKASQEWRQDDERA